MTFSELKYRALVGIFDIAGQFISSQLTKPSYDNQEKLASEYFEELKVMARKEEQKTEKERKQIGYKEPEEPEPTPLDMTTEKIESGTACVACLPPNELIFTNPDVKKIDDIVDTDMILDHTGRYNKIIETMSHPYSGDLYNIFTKYQNIPLRVTPEHPIMVLKALPCPYKQGYCLPGKGNSRCINCDKKIQNNPTFLQAKNLFVTKWKSNYTEDKLYLLIPRLKTVTDINSINLADFINTKTIEKNNKLYPLVHTKPYGKTKSYAQTKGIAINKMIDVDDKLLRLIGFYLAEGYVGHYKRGGRVAFSFGKKEKAYIKDVEQLLLEVFGVNAYIKDKKTATSIEVYSKILASFFAQFGKGAFKKTIPKWIILLPPEKQKALLEGYFKGDGCLSKGKYNHISCTTISPQLIMSVRIILHRLGIINGYRKYNSKGFSEYEGREIRHRHEQHVISIWGKSAVELIQYLNLQTKPWTYRESHQAGMDKDYIYLPIKKIEIEKYSGMVYNLHTENNTYMANYLVHNCSRDHFSTASAALSEALRFARTKGMQDVEVMKRLGTSLDELNIMERIDLAPENIVRLRGKEKSLADWGLNNSRELRHKITAIKTPADLETVAADAARIRTEFMQSLWDVVTVDGSVEKLCRGLEAEEKERCVSVINTVLEKKLPLETADEIGS